MTHSPSTRRRRAALLRHQFDDDEAPTEVTIFSPEEDRTTAWLTIDIDHAVSLEDAR